jgi:hypothetical protein
MALPTLICPSLPLVPDWRRLSSPTYIYGWSSSYIRIVIADWLRCRLRRRSSWFYAHERLLIQSQDALKLRPPNSLLARQEGGKGCDISLPFRDIPSCQITSVSTGRTPKFLARQTEFPLEICHKLVVDRLLVIHQRQDLRRARRRKIQMERRTLGWAHRKGQAHTFAGALEWIERAAWQASLRRRHSTAHTDDRNHQRQCKPHNRWLEPTRHWSARRWLALSNRLAKLALDRLARLRGERRRGKGACMHCGEQQWSKLLCFGWIIKKTGFWTIAAPHTLEAKVENGRDIFRSNLHLLPFDLALPLHVPEHRPLDAVIP